MIAVKGQPRNDDLGWRGWRDRSGRKSVAHDAIVHFRVKRTIVESDAGAPVAAVRDTAAKARDNVGVPVPLGVLKG